MNEVCVKEFGAGLSFRDGGWGPASWWSRGEWIAGSEEGRRSPGEEEGYGILQAARHCLQTCFDPVQASLA